MVHLLSLTFHIFELSKPLNRIQRKLWESQYSTSSTKFAFFRPIRKPRWPSLPLIGWDIFNFFSATPERNWTKLDRKQELNVLYQVCVFWADWKTKITALADLSTKVAHCTRVLYMWPFGPLVCYLQISQVCSSTCTENSYLSVLWFVCYFNHGCNVWTKWDKLFILDWQTLDNVIHISRSTKCRQHKIRLRIASDRFYYIHGYFFF